MNKKIMRFIEKELKKDKSITILHNPTLVEIEYLQSKGINVTHNITTRLGLFDSYYISDLFTYSID